MVLGAKQLPTRRRFPPRRGRACHWAEAGRHQVVKVVGRLFLLLLMLLGRPEMFREAFVVSVDPADRYPLWGQVDFFQSPLQDPNGFIDIIIDNG